MIQILMNRHVHQNSTCFLDHTCICSYGPPEFSRSRPHSGGIRVLQLSTPGSAAIAWLDLGFVWTVYCYHEWVGIFSVCSLSLHMKHIGTTIVSVSYTHLLTNLVSAFMNYCLILRFWPSSFLYIQLKHLVFSLFQQFFFIISSYFFNYFVSKSSSKLTCSCLLYTSRCV